MDEVTKAREALETAVADFGVATSYGRDLPRQAKAAEVVTAALDAFGRACELRGAERMRRRALDTVESSVGPGFSSAAIRLLDPARVVGEGGALDALGRAGR